MGADVSSEYHYANVGSTPADLGRDIAKWAREDPNSLYGFMFGTGIVVITLLIIYKILVRKFIWPKTIEYAIFLFKVSHAKIRDLIKRK